jgi:hypothetical protein
MKKNIFKILIVITIIVFIIVVIYAINLIKYKKGLDNNTLSDNLKLLSISTTMSNITIKRGDKLNLKYDKKNINLETTNHGITITENTSKESTIEITIPEEYAFNQLYLDTTYGNITLENIEAEFFSAKSIEGEINITNSNITNKTDIDIGSGLATVTNTNMNNIDIYIDTGTINLNSTLYGKSDINTSIGTININLLNSIDEYRFVSDEDNNIIVNGKKIQVPYGSGSNKIEVRGTGTLNING